VILSEVVSRHQDWHLVIRPHPCEQIDSTYTPPGSASFSVPSENLSVLLSACDLVICACSSTVALEAYLLKKPAISIELPGVSHNLPYTELGIASVINGISPDQIEAGIIQAFSNTRTECNILAPLGFASQKVANEIEKSIMN
jgi:hypothetical protein